jgi:hypothetical protein
MSLPRVRFTVRRLMVAVAIVGGLIGGSVECRRRLESERRIGEYQRLAKHHHRAAARLRDRYRESPQESVVLFIHSSEFAQTPALKLKWAEYHESLSRKYEQAASNPWAPLPPDPPEPEIVPPYNDY